MQFPDTDGDGKKARRQAYLVRYLEQHQYVSLDEIASLFSVTTQTARRDIMALEHQGKLRRLHGGAVISLPVDTNVYRQRRVANAEPKAVIAKKVAELIPDGSSVFIDTGTTCETIAWALAARNNLRIVTYSLRVAVTLSENSDFTIAVPGGFVRQVDAGVFSENAQAFIRGFKFDYAVISVSAVDDDGDMGDDDYAEVGAQRAAMQQAASIILAIDGSKFHRRALVKLGSLSEADIVVSDVEAPKQLETILRDGKTAFHVAGPSETVEA